MSRISHNIEPLCYTSDGVHLYTIARGYILKDRSNKPEFFIARSNPYPASLNDLTWEVIESAQISFDVDIQHIVYPHTALCGWNPTSSSFAMVVNGLRYGSRMDRLGVSLSTQLLPSAISSADPHTGDSTAQVDLESSTKEILFTFYPKLDTFYEPQVRWSTENFGTNEPPSTVYRLLVANNNNIYVLGSSDNGLVMSIFPESFSSVPPYVTRPTPSAIKTVHHCGVGLDCALESEMTRIIADKETIYLTCYPSKKSGTDMNSYKVYKFEGTKFQQLSPIPLEIISTQTSLDTPFLIPVPNKDSTSAASWGLVSLGDGKSQLYNLTGNTVNNVLLQPKLFQTNRLYTLHPTSIEENRPPITKSATFGMLLGVVGFALLMSLYGIFVYRRNRRAEAMRALEGGVNRVACGDDACDSLPRYTPRAHTAEHSGFFEGIFHGHGRTTRPPSYKTTLSMNLSRSATMATMLASSPSTSPTEPAVADLDMVDISARTITVDDSMAPEMGQVGAAADPASASIEPTSAETTYSITQALAPVTTADVVTTTPLEVTETSATSTNTSPDGTS
ncbi:hypothetical protein BGZ96_011269 [Linnemannia gamsii]|uniref:Uncharacterized protein n=1 Tax=Linnemannia gamsii TaxID=64522 RepID=A0ABQ7JST2_9FUNG|nr:hypothetical protein BGZ96_011269 [Linnemannia gamsii]